MSTEGKGKCCQVVFAPGTAVLDGSAVLGDGIVILGNEFVKWVSKDDRPELEDKAREAAHNDIGTLHELESQAEAAANRLQYEGVGQSQTLSEAEKQAQAQMLAEVRAAVAGVRTLLKSPEELERQQLQLSL